MAGRIRLAVTGIQDQWLTGEPQFSYFVMNYKRHTRFSTEAVEMPFDGKCDFSSSVECRIPQNVGDLIRSTMLKIKLGNLSTDTSTEKYRYNTPAALSIIKHVDLVIGGQIIERLTGDYIYMYNQLHNNKDDVNQSLYFLSGHGEHLQVSDSYNTFYVNIPFYFFRNPSLAVPVCAITKQLVEVRVTFKDINDDVTFKYTIDGSVTKRDKTTEGSIDNVSLITDFYFVAEEERNFLLTRPMEYIISQLQMSKLLYKPNESKKSALLKFKHPVKELFFSAKEKTGMTNVSDPVYTISQPVATINAQGGSVISNNGLVAVTYDNSSTGEVNIYEKDSSGNWPSTASATYTGSSSSEYFGRVLGVSDDGTRVAIQSSTKMIIVEKQSGVWTQIGSDITAPFTAVTGSCLTGDGTKVFGSSSVPDLSSADWSQLGADINGEAQGDYSGYSVSTSSDGTRVAIGAIYNDGTGTGSNAGHVRVYAESGGTWTPVGSDIDGKTMDDLFGYSVSMSSDGTRVAIGAPDNGAPYGSTGTGSYKSGHVRVYEEIGGLWSQVGLDINGEAAGDYFGHSVSMSSDGKRVAIKDIGNRVRVYYESGLQWTQLGTDIQGGASSQLLPANVPGKLVSISPDGTRVVFGDPWNSTISNNAGQVRVYSLSAPTTPTVSSWEYSGGGSWLQYRPDITVNTTVSRISHSTNGEILGLEDATKTVIHATTDSASTYTKRHADTQYSEMYHSLSNDGANLVSLVNLGSKVWNGTNYVYDGAGGTQVPWYTTSASSMVEISRNGSLVFWNDYTSNRFKLYSKSVVDGNVQWTLESSEEYFYTPVKMSALGSDAIIVSGSGSAGAKIYDITVSPGAGEDRLLNISSSDQAFSSHVTNKRSDYRFVKNIRFECNGKRMFDHTGKYLAYEQSLIHHTGCPDPAYEFYTYSFALKPELYYPTGQLNMSRIIHKKLDVELDETSTSRNINFSIYALNYNLLHVEGGLAGLKF
mgnify:CR=1 FL=1